MTDLVGQRAAEVVRRRGCAVANRRVQDDDAILGLTVDVGTSQRRHVAKGATGGVGVDVHVPAGVPGEGVVIATTVIEPSAVVGVGDPARRIAGRVDRSEHKLNLTICSWRTGRSRDRVEVFVQRQDLILNARFRDVSLRSSTVANHMEDNGDLVRDVTFRVVDPTGVGLIATAV